MFDELDDNLKKAKEILVSKIDEWKRDLRMMILALVVLMLHSIVLAGSSDFYYPNVTGFWYIFIVDAVLLIAVLGITIAEEIIYQITDWKKRKNTTKKVSLENEDEQSETEIDDLNNRYQAMLKDLNENYEPMRNLYMRLRNQNAIYSFVMFFCLLTMIFIPSAIDNLYYNTERILWKYLLGVCQLFMDIIIPIHLCCVALNYKKSKL
ncbi:hypothetical protein B9Z55_027471 [Caenorhabditis nigoni]|nr:hypothetical protein B9Z55_027471 [Caenorhabditis nigoni]